MLSDSGVKGALELNGLKYLLGPGVGCSLELLVSGVGWSLELKGLWSWLVCMVLRFVFGLFCLAVGFWGLWCCSVVSMGDAMELLVS